MPTEVVSSSRHQQPYNDIGLIFAYFPDGSIFQGTCSLVGRNDILTATHMVYSPDNGGWATGFEFYFGADYNSIYDYFEDDGYVYFPNQWIVDAWPDQVFTDTSHSTLTQSEAELDMAIIGVNEPIGDLLGWLGLDAGYEGNFSAKAVGYPAGSTGMMQETVFIHESLYHNLYESYLNIFGPGSSGGPLLVGDYVVGVKSTSSWWADVGSVFEQLLDAMAENDSLFDTTAPLVTEISPVNGATGVDPKENIVVRFNETIERGTGNLTLLDADGRIIEIFQVSASDRVSIVNGIMTINPSADLSYGATYQLMADYDSLRDQAGNPFPGGNGYSFTTKRPPGLELNGSEADDVLVGGAGDDSLSGGEGDDRLLGGAGNDLLNGGVGNDTLNGGNDLDIAIYGDNRLDYQISRETSGFLSVSGKDGSDSVIDVERIQFGDINLAFDLNGHAGMVAKTLGAVFGPEAVSNHNYVGIGLYLMDDGMNYETLMMTAIHSRLGDEASHQDVVELLYRNIVGKPPTLEEQSYFVGLLDNNSYSVSELGILAADTDLNEQNINLLGLVQTGIEYDLVT